MEISAYIFWRSFREIPTWIKIVIKHENLNQKVFDDFCKTFEYHSMYAHYNFNGFAGNVYKFRALSHDSAEQWVKELRLTVRGETTGRKPIPTNLMSFEWSISIGGDLFHAFDIGSFWCDFQNYNFWRAFFYISVPALKKTIPFEIPLGWHLLIDWEHFLERSNLIFGESEAIVGSVFIFFFKHVFELHIVVYIISAISSFKAIC